MDKGFVQRRWPKSTWNDVHHHWLLGKCKSKLHEISFHIHKDGYYPKKRGREKENNKCWYVEKLEPHARLVGKKIIQWLRKTVWWFLRRLSNYQYEPTTLILVLYPPKSENRDSNTWMPMFITSLLPIAKNVETIQLFINRWKINKMWYIHAMKYSVVKRNEILIYATEFQRLTLKTLR